MKIPQNGNRANMYGHVAVVHEHVWRTLCSVFVRRARVLPSPCYATRNLSFLRFHRRTLLFQLVVSLEIVRVDMKIPQDGNRANRYGHVAVVHGHVWRTLCSVCATGARVAQPVPCNS